MKHSGYYKNQGKLDRVEENASEPQPIAEYENPDTGRTGTINVSYARDPLAGEILDYDYDEERVGIRPNTLTRRNLYDYRY